MQLTFWIVSFLLGIVCTQGTVGTNLNVLLSRTNLNPAFIDKPEDTEGRLDFGLIYRVTTNLRKGDLICPGNSRKEYLPLRNTWESAKGLKCDSSDDSQDIIVPIIKQPKGPRPKRLTLTVEPDQDVVVEFANLPHVTTVKWQKEPVNPTDGWEFANVTGDGTLLILPAEKSKDSGLYSFMAIRDSPESYLSLGTLALTRKKCPMDRYGIMCTEFCKDCMYGSLCHEDTGECICPPGRRGEFCEEACEGDAILESCTKSPAQLGQLQICFPPPYGCSCVPGYEGFDCSRECDAGHWGVECKQNCLHCESKECDRITGNCINLDPKPCSGGPRGLPRLRMKPVVIPEKRKVTIEFNTTALDGETPEDSTIRYQIRVWEKNANTSEGALKTTGIISSPHTVEGLKPGTDYKLSVLLEVDLTFGSEPRSKSVTCIVDGTLRGERIHMVEFTTKSLKVPNPLRFYMTVGFGNIIFSWNRPEDTEGDEIYYQYEHQTKYLACPTEEPEWHSGNTTDEEFKITFPSPYAVLKFKLRVGNEAGLSDEKIGSVTTRQIATRIEIKTLDRVGETKYNVSLERNCGKVNGEGLTIAARLEYEDSNVANDPRYDQIPPLNTSCSTDIFQCTAYLPERLYRNTDYKIYVEAKNNINDEWFHNFKWDNFITDSVAPLKPENLNASASGDSVMVGWDAPADFPPTGDLEGYKIEWYKENEWHPVATRNTPEKFFYITDLLPNTSYIIKVYAKNKGVEVYGPPSSITLETEACDILPPCNITSSSTETDISISWMANCEQCTRTHNERYYKIQLNGVEYKTNETHFKFGNLRPVTLYNLTLEACDELNCSLPLTRKLYWKPKKPQVDVGFLRVLKDSGNSSIIKLLVVKKFPAWQYVVVFEDKGTLSDKQLKKLALSLVTERIREKLAKNNLHIMDRQQLSVPEVASGDAWIAKEEYIEEGSKGREVDIGTGIGEDNKLADEKEYKLLVVSELSNCSSVICLHASILGSV